jgi:beta-glucosidase
MIGYQSTDGVPITANRWLLREVLRDEWGFTGTLVTDWDNVGRMVWEQQVCADLAEAAAVAVRAGNDLVMTTPRFFEGAQEAVARGLLTEEEIDAAVRRILTVKFELGLFEDPRRPDVARQAAAIGTAAHAEVNLEAARRSRRYSAGSGRSFPRAGPSRTRAGPTSPSSARTRQARRSRMGSRALRWSTRQTPMRP